MANTRTSRSSSSSTVSCHACGKKPRSPAKKRRQKPNPKRRPASPPYFESLALIAQRVARIKRKLVAEAPLHEIIDDFFEGVTTEPAFPLEFHDDTMWLRDAIARSCESILDEPTGESIVHLMAVPELDLIHGSVAIAGYMGVALYFEDIQLGVVGLYPDLDDGGAYYARLVCYDNPADWLYGPN